jgi:hypothetical protein
MLRQAQGGIHEESGSFSEEKEPKRLFCSGAWVLVKTTPRPVRIERRG